MFHFVSVSRKSILSTNGKFCFAGYHNTRDIRDTDSKEPSLKDPHPKEN